MPAAPDAKSADDLVENQQRAAAARALDDAMRATRRAAAAARSWPAAARRSRRRCARRAASNTRSSAVVVVERRDERVAEVPSGMPALDAADAAGEAAAGLHEHRVGVAVIAAFELENRASVRSPRARRAARTSRLRCPTRRSGCARPTAAGCAIHSASSQRVRLARAERPAVVDRGVHGRGDVGIGVAEDQRAEALAEIDVAAAVDVDEPRAAARARRRRDRRRRCETRAPDCGRRRASRGAPRSQIADVRLPAVRALTLRARSARASRAPYVMMYAAPARRNTCQVSSSAASQSVRPCARERQQARVFAAHLVRADRLGRSPRRSGRSDRSTSCPASPSAGRRLPRRSARSTRSHRARDRTSIW